MLACKGELLNVIMSIAHDIMSAREPESCYQISGERRMTITIAAIAAESSEATNRDIRRDRDMNDKIKDVSVSQRQIYILSLLSQNPKGYLAEEIRERLHHWDIDVTKRTIQRDIDELSLNYGIGEEERAGKTYYYADKYTLQNVDFTIEDLASLAFAKEMLGTYEHLDMGQHAMALIDKIVANSASLNQLQFEKLCGHFRQAGADKRSVDTVDSRVEKQIQSAIDSQSKIQISYYSFSSDTSSQRIIHPYRLLLLDAFLCVEGYCELRKEVRRFRLSRIQDIRILDEHFTDQEQEPDTFLNLSGDKKEEIEFVFTGESIRYVKEFETKRANRLEEQPDGLHFYQTAAIAPDVIRWVRGFGPEVDVRKPEWLREQLLQEAQQRIHPCTASNVGYMVHARPSLTLCKGNRK